jgi:hypothetical protein
LKALTQEKRRSFDGALGVVHEELAVTSAVAADEAVVEPAELLAVRETRMVDPTSPKPRRYVLLVAPTTDAQDAPLESQRCHWYPYVMGVVPLHEPADAVSA